MVEIEILAQHHPIAFATFLKRKGISKYRLIKDESNQGYVDINGDEKAKPVEAELGRRLYYNRRDKKWCMLSPGDEFPHYTQDDHSLGGDVEYQCYKVSDEEYGNLIEHGIIMPKKVGHRYVSMIVAMGIVPFIWLMLSTFLPAIAASSIFLAPAIPFIAPIIIPLLTALGNIIGVNLLEKLHMRFTQKRWPSKRESDILFNRAKKLSIFIGFVLVAFNLASALVPVLFPALVAALPVVAGGVFVTALVSAAFLALCSAGFISTLYFGFNLISAVKEKRFWSHVGKSITIFASSFVALTTVNFFIAAPFSFITSLALEVGRAALGALTTFGIFAATYAVVHAGAKKIGNFFKSLFGSKNDDSSLGDVEMADLASIEEENDLPYDEQIAAIYKAEQKQEHVSQMSAIMERWNGDDYVDNFEPDRRAFKNIFKDVSYREMCDIYGEAKDTLNPLRHKRTGKLCTEDNPIEHTEHNAYLERRFIEAITDHPTATPSP